MGDNIFLGDRNGVRTPMQWSADRNAGFSRANPQRLILPITIDPEYHYEAINVEAQQNNPNSLLWWSKRLIALRRRFQAFGRGSIEFLTPSNHRVLAFIRQYEKETVLVVANLSRFVQYVELDLAKWKGMRPVELMGSTGFPTIGELPYLLTLGGHAFYWFSLESPPGKEEAELAANYTPPVLEATSMQTLIAGADRYLLEDVLPSFLYTRRWFVERARLVTAVHVQDAVALGGVYVVIVRVEFAEGEDGRFVLPLAAVTDGRQVAPQAILGIVRTRDGDQPLIDALEDSAPARELLDAVAAHRRVAVEAGFLEATPFVPLQPAEGEPRNISAQHASAAIRYGDQYLLKMFRRFDEGISPELEIARCLNARAPGVSPEVVGAIEVSRSRIGRATLAVLQAYVPNEGTAWVHARETLRRFFERVLTRHREEPAPEAPPRSALAAAELSPPPALRDIIGPYLELAVLLGKRTAAMHLALASNREDPAFAPEAYTTLDRRSKYQSMRNIIGKTLRDPRVSLPRLPNHALRTAHLLADSPERILRVIEPLLTRRLAGLRIRIHGDFHLEQALYTGKDFVIIDFEGRPSELAERRRKNSPLRDVAGMIRSFHYAALTALLDGVSVREEDRGLVTPWAEAWHRWVSAAFLSAYLEDTRNAAFIPGPEELALILDTHLLEKAFSELHGELERCAESVLIPLEAVAELVAGP